MILIALGGNLSSPAFGPPLNTLQAALAALAAKGVGVAALSRWYETEPVPVSDQPWFVNAVAAVETDLTPPALLAQLHEIEESFGRVRRERWEARIIDIDLLAYHDLVLPDVMSWGKGGSGGLVIPHPRLHLRRFVLEPLLDVAPDWRHPVLKRSARDLLRHLAPDGIVRPVPLGNFP